MKARLLALLGCAAFVTGGFVAVAPQAVAAESISVSVTPSSPVVDQMIVVNATVSGASMTPNLTAVRTDRNGQHPMFTLAPTGTPGEYSGNDPLPAAWGTMTYVVTDNVNSASGKTSVYVTRHPTALTIKRARKVVSAGWQAHVTAHLGTTDTNRSLTIYARPYNRDRTQIASGNVSATTGNLSASYTMARRTRFYAHFGGDLKYRPATVSVVVLARAVVREHLRGGYATDGAYRLFHVTDNPVLAVHLIPELDGACLRFRAERYFDGRWHLDAVGCVRTDPYGRAIGVLTGDHHLNSPYRVRARWPGTYALLARSGAWQRLEFRP